MKKNLTEIVIVLDESGSMSSCKSDTIGGFNEFLSSQKKIKGDANVTLVKFSDYYKMINDGTPLESVSALNESNYTPSNSTALLDAVGKTINKIGDRLANTPEDEKPEKVIFAVITDGFENASREFKQKQIFDMVTHQKTKYSWEFLFLGADIDSWGKEIGISSNVNVSKDAMFSNMSKLSYYTSNYRVGSANFSTDNFTLSDTQVKEEMEKLYKESGKEDKK